MSSGNYNPNVFATSEPCPPIREPQVPGAPIQDYVLAPNEVQAVKLDGQHIATAAANKLQFGRTAPTLAVVRAANMIFTVLDMRGRDHDAPLMIVDQTYNAINKSGHKKGYKNIRDGDTVKVGRDHFTDRFDYSSTVSRSHFDLILSGNKLKVRNRHPTNITRISGDVIGVYPARTPLPVPPPRPRIHNIRDDYTANLGRDAAWRHDFGPADANAVYGYHKNHPVIGRESKSVKGGVYFTTQPMSEAVVVDDKSSALRRAADDVSKFIQNQEGTGYKAHDLSEYRRTAALVERYVSWAMVYNNPQTDLLVEPYRVDNGLIGLSDFVNNRFGVCRQQCLFAAFLLETLIDKGVIKGEVAVERNQDDNLGTAHAWTVLRTPHGTLLIDPAQHFVGTKQEAAIQGRWRYHLNSDRD